jgi:hypothetical protein
VNTVNLLYPITVNGAMIDMITLRRPKVRDLVYAEQYGKDGDESYGAALAASMAGLSFEEFGEIDRTDAIAIGKAVGVLLGNAKSADGDGSPS